MMITKGLFYDFFGGSKTSPTEAISEQKFDIHVKEDGKDYKIYGFIDKLFLYSQEQRAVIRDFKNLDLYKLLAFAITTVSTLLVSPLVTLVVEPLLS